MLPGVGCERYCIFCKIIAGDIRWRGRSLLSSEGRQFLQKVRGKEIAMIFQEPMTSLNPVYTIGNQLMEPLILHRSMAKKKAEKEAIRLLDRTGIDDPAGRLGLYPHQLSGGQRQRVAIARAVIMNPAVILADEPTGNLDRTSGDEIIQAVESIREQGMTVIIVTHDPNIGSRAVRAIRMVDGRIVSDSQGQA